MSAKSCTKITPISYEQFIEQTLIPGIKKMQEQGLVYLSFGVIATAIEALGAFYDSHPFNIDGYSKNRFKQGINKLFKKLGKRYEHYVSGKKGDDYCLYKNLRCGMAHIGRPMGNVIFTTREEAKKDNHQHLQKNKDGKLVLIAEELADDFESAWNELKNQSNSGATQKKVDDEFIRVFEYEES